MTKTMRTTATIIMALLALAVGYWLGEIDKRPASVQEQAIAKAVEEKQNAVVKAVSLLPKDQHPEAIRQINDHLFWFLTTTKQIWLTDTQQNQSKLLGNFIYSEPYTVLMTEPRDRGYVGFKITSDDGLHETEYNIYLTNTGKYLASTMWQDEKIWITLDPKDESTTKYSFTLEADPCEKEGDHFATTVRGLRSWKSGRVISFKSPHKAPCHVVPIDIGGEELHPFLGKPYFEYDPKYQHSEFITIGLPWESSLWIDLRPDHLMEIHYPDFEESPVKVE